MSVTAGPAVEAACTHRAHVCVVVNGSRRIGAIRHAPSPKSIHNIPHELVPVTIMVAVSPTVIGLGVMVSPTTVDGGGSSTTMFTALDVTTLADG